MSRRLYRKCTQGKTDQNDYDITGRGNLSKTPADLVSERLLGKY